MIEKNDQSITLYFGWRFSTAGEIPVITINELVLNIQGLKAEIKSWHRLVRIDEIANFANDDPGRFTRIAQKFLEDYLDGSNGYCPMAPQKEQPFRQAVLEIADTRKLLENL